MKQEDKQLLLVDLCARLPHHVRCKVWLKDGTTEEGQLDLEHNYADVLLDAFYYNKIKNIKPYLRPMSSMTSKEWVEFCDCSVKDEASWVITMNRQKLIPVQNREDYLNSKHFDYRGLIEKGLALEAPEGMYNIKEK